MKSLADVSKYCGVTKREWAATWLGTELDDYGEMFLHIVALKENHTLLRVLFDFAVDCNSIVDRRAESQYVYVVGRYTLQWQDEVGV